MEQPIIGIAANELDDAGATLHHLPISYTPAGYVKAVQLAGGLPIVVPIGAPQTAKNYVAQIDKLILAGGQNIAADLYGETNLVSEAQILGSRDSFEIALLYETFLQKKPVFAVCRGLQLANVALGGSLYQSLTGITTVAHMQVPIPRQEVSHAITTAPKSCLRQIYGEHTKVNSFHYQAVHRVANYLRVAAVSEDGIIEALESQTAQFRFLGVQWHPDFSYAINSADQALFNYVVQTL